MRTRATSAVAAIVLLSTSAQGHVDGGTPSAVIAEKVGAGVVFTDRSGMSLYTYARDESGKSSCVQACATVWPPLAAAEESRVAQEWSIVLRPDGARQWAYKGQPLYAYAKDAAPGTSFGDDVGEVWHVARQDMWTPPEITIGPSLIGRVLVDAKGMTLYTHDGDKVRGTETADLSAHSGATPTLASGCTKHCVEAWHSLIAPAIAVARGDWTIVRREDGELQWAFRGRPLYTYANDLAPTDTLGNGADSAWHAAVVEPPLPLPAWVTIQASDAGELLGNASGFTIYAFNAARNHGTVTGLSAPATCDADCIHAFWKPVAAQADAKPVGNWSIVKNDDGSLQWAYKGQPLYTHARDKKPGEFSGTKFPGSRAWNPIMRSGHRMQGVGGN